MVRISLFNWNGTLLTDVKKDEKEFSITIAHVPGEGCMGFEVFDVEGLGLNIALWLIHYDLDDVLEEALLMAEDDNIPLGDWGSERRHNRSRKKPDLSAALERLAAVRKREKPAPRSCFHCGGSAVGHHVGPPLVMGCFAFTWKQDGKARRDYFHPACFREFKQKVETGE